MSTRKLSAALVVALALPLALPGLAHADAPKYTRKTRDIQVKQTDKTKKLKLEAKEQAAGPDKSITADQFFQIEAAVQGDVDLLIEGYKEQLEDLAPDDPLRMDLGFRLAEAFAQKQRYHHSLAMEAAMRADRARTKRDKERWAAQSKAELENERKWLLEAIKVYKSVVEHPNAAKFPRIDEVVFYYAFTLQTAGYAAQARNVYKLLLKNYQGSRFVPDAYLAFADFYFEQRDLGNAEAFYNKVLQFPKSPLYVYAIYKRGWVYFNQSRFADAMRAFKDVVGKTNGQKRYSTLNRTSKKDFVRMYAESNSPVNVAYRAFQGLDRTDFAFKMFNMLGDYYMDQGKAEKAIYVFHQMMKMRPKAKEICEWQYNVVRARMTIGTNQQKVDELANLVKLYTFVKGKRQLPRQNLEECRDNAAGVTAELAQLWHLEGLKTLNPETLGYADQLYHVYLDHFPDAGNAAQMQFNYAELMWKRAEMEKDPKLQPKRWEEAAAEHSKVVNMKGVDGAVKKDSAYATVLAWKNALAVDPATDVPEGDEKNADDFKPQPIPDKEQKMLQAFRIYLGYVKDEKDEERTQILFFTGRMYWRHYHFDKAIPYLAEVVAKHPEHEFAYAAMNVLLDSLNKAGKHKEMLAWVDRLNGNKKFLDAHPDAKQILSTLHRQAMRKRAEEFEKAQAYRECGFAYEAYIKEYPNDPKMDEVLFNAAVCFQKAKLLGRAIRFRVVLTQRPDAAKNPLAQRAQLALGDNYSQIAQYDKAAEMYEKYVAQFGGEKDAPAALNYATFFRKGLGQDDLAIKDTELYIKMYGKKEPREAAGAAYSIANIYEKNKQYDDMIEHLEKYIRTWGSKGGIDLRVIAHVRAGEALWKKSCPVAGVNGACIAIQRERALKDATRGKKKKKRKIQQTQCGDVSKSRIRVFERDPRIVRQAQRHFHAAIKLWKGGASAKDVVGKDETTKTARIAETIRWVAAAQFYLGEEKYEEFLRVKFPTGLDFDERKKAKKKDSIKRFTKWLTDKKKSSEVASRYYRAIYDQAISGGINIYAAQWAIASAARIGQVLQGFSDALFTAEIPKEVRSYQDAIDAYCDQMTQEADPLEEASIKAFKFCLDTSNKLSWFNEWSRLCEAELAQIRPQDFPAAGEIRGAPDNIPTTLDTQPIVLEIDTRSAAKAGTN